ncbi:MAG: tetraacyldisaccharide 4'-kinase [Rhodospirillaceae bacterium]
MQPPDFWYSDQQGPMPLLLSPFSSLYALGGKLRQVLTTPASAGVPVICVGNLTAGGTGKTPTVLKLAQLLGAQGRQPHILSRGYGAQISTPVRVDPARHTYRDVGDEPLLLAQTAPTWVSSDRVTAAAAAIAAGADTLILDDGFQNPRLKKDFSLLVVDGAAGFGNGRIIPAGPLRETVLSGAARADALLIIGEDKHGVSGMPELSVLPNFSAQLAPVGGEALAGKRLHAFAGIGRPEKFFATLTGLGAELLEKTPFPDHHPYSVDEVERLVQKAAAMDATLITTAKDHTRLAPQYKGIEVLDVALELTDQPAVLNTLAPALERSS